jgi:branched-chain amino acid transport system substrate-binding protein
MRKRDLMKLAIIAATAGLLAGPLAGGAVVTYWPNVQLWIHDVNARGGLDVGGKKYLLEAVEYDDQTNPGETIKAVERLVNQDGAQIVLPPYSTGLNLAVAPLFAKYGLPMVTSTCTSDQIEMLSKQFPNMFFTLGGANGITGSVAELLKAKVAAGEIGNKVAMVNVADAFGIELAEAARPAFAAAGLEIVYDTSYPLGTQDLSPVVKAAKSSTTRFGS